jgi:hypothetical protein
MAAGGPTLGMPRRRSRPSDLVQRGHETSHRLVFSRLVDERLAATQRRSRDAEEVRDQRLSLTVALRSADAGDNCSSGRFGKCPGNLFDLSPARGASPCGSTSGHIRTRAGQSGAPVAAKDALNALAIAPAGSLKWAVDCPRIQELPKDQTPREASLILQAWARRSSRRLQGLLRVRSVIRHCTGARHPKQESAADPAWWEWRRRPWAYTPLGSGLPILPSPDWRGCDLNHGGPWPWHAEPREPREPPKRPQKLDLKERYRVPASARSPTCCRHMA